jgi:hypothetical protein
MEIPDYPKSHIHLSKRLRSSFRWYVEHPEDLQTVSGMKFREILKSQYPDVNDEFERLVGNV